MIHKILGVFVNTTLRVNDKHYLPNRDNLTQSIPIQFSQKQRTFLNFFLAVFKSILNFKDFPEKDDRDSWCISPNTGSEKHC